MTDSGRFERKLLAAALLCGSASPIFAQSPWELQPSCCGEQFASPVQGYGHSWGHGHSSSHGHGSLFGHSPWLPPRPWFPRLDALFHPERYGGFGYAGPAYYGDSYGLHGSFGPQTGFMAPGGCCGSEGLAGSGVMGSGYLGSESYGPEYGTQGPVDPAMMAPDGFGPAPGGPQPSGVYRPSMPGASPTPIQSTPGSDIPIPSLEHEPVRATPSWPRQPPTSSPPTDSFRPRPPSRSVAPSDTPADSSPAVPMPNEPSPSSFLPPTRESEPVRPRSEPISPTSGAAEKIELPGGVEFTNEVVPLPQESARRSNIHPAAAGRFRPVPSSARAWYATSQAVTR